MPWALGQDSSLQIISLCRERELVVEAPSEKTMPCVLRGGNSTWNWLPFLCHHLVIFLFSSEGSPGSAGSDRCSVEQSPSPSHPTSPTLSKAEWKGQMWSQTILTGDWFPPSFLPKSLFSLLMFGWIIPILTKSKEEQKEIIPKDLGRHLGEKVQKRKPQRFSALEMVSKQIHPDWLICAGHCDEGKRMEQRCDFWKLSAIWAW